MNKLDGTTKQSDWQKVAQVANGIRQTLTNVSIYAHIQNEDYATIFNLCSDLLELAASAKDIRAFADEYETYLVKATDSRRGDQKFYVEAPAALDVDELDHYIQGVTRNLYPGAVVRTYYWIKKDAAAASNGDGEARDE